MSAKRRQVKDGSSESGKSSSESQYYDSIEHSDNGVIEEENSSESQYYDPDDDIDNETINEEDSMNIQYYDSDECGSDNVTKKKPKKYPLDEILVVNSKFSHKQRLVYKLLEEKLIEHKCNMCRICPVWQEKTLVLQLDHINGTNNDNRIENLRLLCPNCHSQTDTYGGKNIFRHKCISCNKKINGKYDRCNECYQKEGIHNIVHHAKSKKCECGNLIWKRSEQCKSCYTVNKKKNYHSKKQTES